MVYVVQMGIIRVNDIIQASCYMLATSCKLLAFEPQRHDGAKEHEVY